MTRRFGPRTHRLLRVPTKTTTAPCSTSHAHPPTLTDSSSPLLNTTRFGLHVNHHNRNQAPKPCSTRAVAVRVLTGCARLRQCGVLRKRTTGTNHSQRKCPSTLYKSHRANPPYNDQRAPALRLTDPLAPLNNALRSRGGVRVDASAPRV